MDFVKNYMDNADFRHLLSDLTSQIFNFTFEDWYTSGFYHGEYIPYSFIENGKLIANASANIMKMAQNGNEKLYIQIGTVMTRPEYRNRGLARKLIYMILDDYKEQVDGFYLYANLNALDFYKKLGFQRLDQWQYHKEYASVGNNQDYFVKAGESNLEEYKQLLEHAWVNPRMDHLNRTSLQLFYTGKMENVYCDGNSSCFVVANIEKDTLYLNSVISATEIPITEVLARIPGEFHQVILGFTPRAADAAEFLAEPYDGGEDYRFFYLGESLKEIYDERLCLPLMSHA